MIIASIETWQDGSDQPLREYEKEFFSREALNAWVNKENQHPFMWTIVKGTTEIE